MNRASLTTKLMNVATRPKTIGIMLQATIANHWPYLMPSLVANDTPVKYSAVNARMMRIESGEVTAAMTP